LHLAFAPQFVAPPSLSTAFAALEPDWARVPVAYELRLSGPSLGIDSAAGIGAGDMVLIGNRSVAARIIWPLAGPSEGCMAPSEIDRSVSILGRYDLISGNFTTTGPTSIEQESMTMAATDPSNAQDAPANAGFVVPVSIRLPVRMASVADLSTMRVGTTLSLGPVTQGLAVSLMVADREIAHGELVQLGDQFAVLIDAQPELATAPVEPTPSESAP
jgi:flagellar motor switch/type III secretory pathway protein FliN